MAAYKEVTFVNMSIDIFSQTGRQKKVFDDMFLQTMNTLYLDIS